MSLEKEIAELYQRKNEIHALLSAKSEELAGIRAGMARASLID